MIDTYTNAANITHMCQDHYNSLLNGVEGNSSEQLIHHKLGTLSGEYIGHYL